LISLGDTATAQGISSTDVAEDIATALSGRYNFQKHSNNIWIDSENELVIGIRGKELLIASTSALDQSPSSLKEFPGRILKAVQDVTESGDLTDQKVEYVDLISADAGKLTVEGKPVIGRGIENLRKILGAETKSKALEPTERVKAYLWAGVSSHTLGLSLTEEVTFNLEAHTFGEIIFMIIFRQMEGKNSYVTRPLDDAAAFALVQAVTGPYSRDRWESQKSDAKRSGGTYFLPGPGFYWLDTLADFRDERENGWWREVAVFEQARVVYGVRTVIPDWPGRGVGGALTE
jgi:hypothetical protein